MRASHLIYKVAQHLFIVCFTRMLIGNGPAVDEKLFTEFNYTFLTSDTLVHFDEDMPLVLVTDASDKGVGAVLMHRFTDGTE